MTDVPYTHGHHESVLRSHRWRTADNSAAYLLAHLQRGTSVLDVGCGPGTITADLARLVAPGRVVGLDPSEEVVAAARADTADAALPSLSFVTGSVFNLRFGEGAFDVVHAHQVLQHVGDPVAALVEMRRVCRPGGIVAARDSDYPGFRYFPEDPELDRAILTYGELTRRNGAHWDAGRRLLSWAHAAGFTTVVPTASVWCFATPTDREWWGGLWADRFLRSAMADQLLSGGLASEADLASFASAWHRWAASPDGWFVAVHGEVVATA